MEVSRTAVSLFLYIHGGSDHAKVLFPQRKGFAKNSPCVGDGKDGFASDEEPAFGNSRTYGIR